MKRIFALAAAAVLAVCAVPASAYAEGDFDGHTAVVDGVTYTYTIEDSEPAGITIMSASPAEGALTIPDEIDGHTVIGIGEKAFLGQTKLEFVYFPSKLEYIDRSAFSACTAMTQLVIPDSVQFIKDSAFMGCYSLTSVSVGKGVTEIPYECFFGCGSLKEAYLPDGLKTIGAEAFFGCPELDTLIPESVTDIGYSAIGYQSDAHSSYTTKVNGFIIGGKTGSAAETYANKNSFDFLDPDNYLAGDVNKDGRVDAKDASTVLAEYGRASTGVELLFSPWQKIVGDMKPDKVIDANDASKILIEYARLSTLSDT